MRRYLFPLQVGLIYFFIILFLAACAPELETAVIRTPLPAPTISTQAVTAVPSTAPPQATSTPQATAVPTILSSPTATIFGNLQVISSENAGQLIQLAQWGNGRIDGLTWSSDGATFAVGSSQGVDFYDSQTLQIIQTIRDEQIGGTVHVRLSPTGKFLIMTMGGGEMDRVTLWDTGSGSFLRDLYDAVLTDFSPEGLLVYFDWATQQIVWQDPATGENERTIALPYTPRAFNLASKTTAEIYLDTSVRLYDMESGEVRHALELPDIIDDIAFSPAGDLLATSSRDGFVRLWNVQNGGLVSELKGEEGRIMDILWSPNGRIIAGSSGDRPIVFWDTGTGRLLHQISQQPGCSSNGIAAFSPDGREFAAVSRGAVHFYDTADGALQRTLDNGYCFASDLAFNPDSSTLFTVGGSTLFTVDLPGGLSGQGRQIDMAAAGIAISPDGQQMVVGGGADQAWLMLWDLMTGQPLYTVAEAGEPIHQVVFSPDGRLLVTQSGSWQEPLVQLRTAGTGVLLASYPANTFVFTPDGRFLATSITPYAAETAGIDLWDTSTFQSARRFDTVTLLGIGPDGTLLASEGFGSVSWWDVATGQRLQPFLPTDGPIAAHAFSANGRLLLGTGPYGFMEMWDAATGQGVWSLYNGQKGTFSQDGRFLATISIDGIVRLWGVPDGRP